MLEKEKFERICKYLKERRYLKTLSVLEKPKLSFEIIKPPKRKEVIPNEAKKEKQKKEKVPEEFKKIARKAGIDPKLFQFFYERREFFNWSLFKPMVHCTEKNCNYKTEHADGCLNDHMVHEHAFEDVPCQKDNCKFIAYSKKTLAFHMSRFHNFRTRKSSGT
jgi:transcriptional regulator of met regulon